MLIESPCRLGEQFTHTRTWGDMGPRHLVGMNFFLWSLPQMGDVTLQGRRSLNDRYNVGFFISGRDTETLYAFQVPDQFFRGGLPVREMGLEGDRLGSLWGICLDGDNKWSYRVFLDKGGMMVGRSALLDRLFAPVLPAVAVQVADFM